MKSNITLFESAARTATVNSSDIENASAITVVVDATASAATPSVVVKIQGKDLTSGKYYDILTGAAITGISTNVYKVGQGTTAATNLAGSECLPQTVRVRLEHADTDSITYSVGASITE